MCGIFGFITQTGHGPDLSRLKRLALETERRGRHAFGLAWISANGRLHTFKRPGAASICLDDLNRCRGAQLVIGHCRWATHGPPEDNRNNHPHPAGRGWLVHNGVVFNHAGLARRYRLRLRTQCDSEVLGKLTARCGGSLLTRAARVVAAANGPLAILGAWRSPPRLLIVRRGKPLHFGETADGLYLASLPNGLPGRVLPVAEDRVCVLVSEKGQLRFAR
jgi:glucosamine--fructose-6-phosphate aminotransferase (isomerizing)